MWLTPFFAVCWRVLHLRVRQTQSVKQERRLVVEGSLREQMKCIFNKSDSTHTFTAAMTQITIIESSLGQHKRLKSTPMMKLVTPSPPVKLRKSARQLDNSVDTESEPSPSKKRRVDVPSMLSFYPMTKYWCPIQRPTWWRSQERQSDQRSCWVILS